MKKVKRRREDKIREGKVNEKKYVDLKKMKNDSTTM